MLGKRADGYHELETVMQAIDFHDDLEVTLQPVPPLTFVRTGLPIDGPPEEDLCVRAARAFCRATDLPERIAIRLHKRIPPGSGLGGGSSDAAHVLLALNDLFGRPLEGVAMQDLASHIGSDVSFFLTGGRALCHGRGERITALNDSPHLVFVLVTPPVHVPTSLIYSTLELTHQIVPVNPLLLALEFGEVDTINRCAFNRLESVALGQNPSLRSIKSEVEAKTSVPFRVTGSGSAFYRVVRNLQEGTRLQAIVGECVQGDVIVAEGVAGWANGAGKGEAPWRSQKFESS